MVYGPELPRSAIGTGHLLSAKYPTLVSSSQPYDNALQQSLEHPIEARIDFSTYISRKKEISEKRLQKAISNCTHNNVFKFKEFHQFTFRGVLTLLPSEVFTLSLKASSATQHAGIADEEFCAFTEKHPEIERLRLNGCSSLTEKGLLSIPEHCKQLRLLGVDHPLLSDEWVKASMESLEKLECLDLAGDTMLSDAALDHIATHARSLRKLSICVKNDEESLSFSSEGVCNFLTRIQNLERLTLENVSGIDDAALLAFAKNNGATLKAITLYGCSQVTSQGIKDFIEACPQLDQAQFFQGSSWGCEVFACLSPS